MLVLGITRSAKTSLLRHLIGSDLKVERLPSTSTARTTASEIELITAQDDLSFKL